MFHTVLPQLFNFENPSSDSSLAGLPDYMFLEETYACFRPEGRVTLNEAIDLVDHAVRVCRESQITGLLLNITRLNGFDPPTTIDRYYYIERLSKTAGGRVVVAMVSRPELIDPEKIGVTMAQNRGFRTDVFTDESEARTWLTNSLASKNSPSTSHETR